MDVAVLLYDGFDELDGIGPYEVFDYAGGYLAEADDGRTLTVRYVTVDERETVVASHGTRVGVDEVLPDADDADAPDLLVVPGGGWSARRETASAWAEAKKGEIPDVLVRYHESGVRIASVCTGAMLLATGGVTEGRRATTHASAIDELESSGAVVVDGRVVDDGDIVTAGGVTSGIDLALYIVEREFGETIADRITTVMEYERSGRVAVD